MFSGIVYPGRVERVEKRGEDLRIYISLENAGEIAIGDSVSVNGVCLTAIEKNGKTVAFDVMPETQDKTNLGGLSPPSKVNIELSLRPMDRLGGHFVLGHIDGTGKIVKRERDGRYAKIWVMAGHELTNMMVPKGAVALDGVSMTLVDVEKGKFSVCVIPHTLETTTLGQKKPGQVVNLEIDILGKYIKKYLGEIKSFK